jgi:hypothetical protein
MLSLLHFNLITFLPHCAGKFTPDALPNQNGTELAHAFSTLIFRFSSENALTKVKEWDTPTYGQCL